MSRRTCQIATAVVLLATSAVAGDVGAIYDEEADFSKYRTYAWREGMPAGQPRIQQAIVGSIDYELQTRGWKLVEDGADVFVRTTVATMSGFDRSSNIYLFPFYSAMELKDITEGTMLVDITPVGSEKPIFHGLVKASGSGPNPEKKAKRVKKMINKLFKDFPALPATGS